jgi:hypothetical protein
MPGSFTIGAIMSITIPYKLETRISGLLVCLCGLACTPGEASDGSLDETDVEWTESTIDTPRSQKQRNDVVPTVEPPGGNLGQPEVAEPELSDVDIPHCWDPDNHSASWCLAACNNSLVYECMYGPVQTIDIPDGKCGEFAKGYCSDKGGLYDACWGYGPC